ncbi:hypothetical protein CA233_19635 [Sphingomonas sp. ABOLD]|uniref:Phage shock protein B n=1 Tax=Sphingomonas trueperi TaxID=53317 RepID=A0A7X5XYS6_9SPHN|nr:MULTISPECIES: hypothetical protein [Sphingomonas]NJB97859.1 hypothetical protein [Sphingomonas trueperi]RSV40560.1 hypothetical protein CA233_19635 [Sphingomonas sp. ABOLD]
MNPFEMVVAIIVVITIGKVLQARYGVVKASRGDRMEGLAVRDPTEKFEADRLRDEIRALKERVQVLERVITDNENSLRLDHEIEKLRDKNRI